jgi:hypothetical protein
VIEPMPKPYERENSPPASRGPLIPATAIKCGARTESEKRSASAIRIAQPRIGKWSRGIRCGIAGARSIASHRNCG